MGQRQGVKVGTGIHKPPSWASCRGQTPVASPPHPQTCVRHQRAGRKGKVGGEVPPKSQSPRVHPSPPPAPHWPQVCSPPDAGGTSVPFPLPPHSQLPAKLPRAQDAGSPFASRPRPRLGSRGAPTPAAIPSWPVGVPSASWPVPCAWRKAPILADHAALCRTLAFLVGGFPWRGREGREVDQSPTLTTSQ